MMNDNQTKKVIVVLSPGRSGTSLLMKALGALGMSLSENMIPGSLGNPEGFYEDAEIVDVHKELLQELNTHPALPLPDGWIESVPAKKARPKLRQTMENRLIEAGSFWGFKDPRTASFLPLWSRILNAPGVVPVFLLAVRDPAAVASSLKRQINRKEEITELQWLVRTTDALYHTAADCFIVHYEDWFTRPAELVRGLLAHTGLGQTFTGNMDEALKDIVKPNLNRAVYEDYEVRNEYVRKLYDVLKEIRGSAFDRDLLIAIVKECRKAMSGFKGWYMEAHKVIEQKTQIRDQLDRNKQARGMRTDKEWKNDLHEITLQNNRYLKQVKDLQEEKENLRIGLSCLKNELGEVEKVKTALEQEREKEQKENQRLLTQAQAEMEKLKKELERISAKEREREKKHRKDLQIRTLIKRLCTLVRALEKDYFAVKNSSTWQVGNFLVQLMSLFLFRKKHPLVTDHLERIFNDYRDKMPTAEFTPEELAQLKRWVGQIEKDFSDLFSSKRWKIGNGLISIPGRIFSNRKKSTAEDHIASILKSFEQNNKEQLSAGNASVNHNQTP